jgi:glutathione synthase/RimK-type ligase-like ATP-grasp enzyme
MTIAFVSLEMDLHVHAVASRLREQFGKRVHIFASDDYAASGRLTIEDARSQISDYSGNIVDLSDIDVVWWRRANQKQKKYSDTGDAGGADYKLVHEFISSEWRFSLFSAWSSGFKGRWVNKPEADVHANSKSVQMNVARLCGFSVPKTLISNDAAKIREFLSGLDGGAVIKKIAGVHGVSLATVPIEKYMIKDEEVSLSPAIYQERVEAERHFRTIVLGEDVINISFSSRELDWRRNLNFKAIEKPFDVGFHSILMRFMRTLGLEMGVFDFIQKKNGDVVFLEVNPQGQFLFLEKLANIDITQRCAAFFARLDGS